MIQGVSITKRLLDAVLEGLQRKAVSLTPAIGEGS